ncbi:hypothetical protein pb186bvf_016544 [Paramecium bursaria]
MNQQDDDFDDKLNELKAIDDQYEEDLDQLAKSIMETQKINQLISREIFNQDDPLQIIETTTEQQKQILQQNTKEIADAQNNKLSAQKKKIVASFGFIGAVAGAFGGVGSAIGGAVSTAIGVAVSKVTQYGLKEKVQK